MKSSLPHETEMHPSPGPAAERYDTARCRAHDGRLPPGHPVPQPTSAWPAENVALLEHYREWLLSSGTSNEVVGQLYIPMAGNALGLNLKPHAELDIDADLERALDYVKAKSSGPQWTKNCGNALERFRFFLRQHRGQIDVQLRPINRGRFCDGLPDWLVDQLQRYQHLRQGNWRPARLNEQIVCFWSGHVRLWRWLFEHYSITNVADIKRQYIFDYVDHRLAAGYAAKSINQELRYFRAFLRHLREHEFQVPLALLHIPGLKEPDSLPKFLTDAQVRLVRDDLEGRVAQARSASHRRDAMLDRATFYLLWQGGLRLSEAEELRLPDLDLSERKLMVRQGKGRRDRAVYLTDTAVRALRDYLTVRGMGTTDHVFLYRHRPVRKDLIRGRIKASGSRVGVKVSPHRLRHTFATQLLNAGCRVTSIQKLLGHRRLNSTMIYARVHDRAVADDYFAAMAEIEKGMDPAPEPDGPNASLAADERAQLLVLVGKLAEPKLDFEARLDLAAQMRGVLHRATPHVATPTNGRVTAASAALASISQSW